MICGAYIAPCSDQTDKQKKIGKIYAFKVFATDLMEEGKKTNRVVMEEVVIFVVDVFYRRSNGIWTKIYGNEWPGKVFNWGRLGKNRRNKPVQKKECEWGHMSEGKKTEYEITQLFDFCLN